MKTPRNQCPTLTNYSSTTDSQNLTRNEENLKKRSLMERFKRMCHFLPQKAEKREMTKTFEYLIVSFVIRAQKCAGGVSKIVRLCRIFNVKHCQLGTRGYRECKCRVFRQFRSFKLLEILSIKSFRWTDSNHKFKAHGNFIFCSRLWVHITKKNYHRWKLIIHRYFKLFLCCIFRWW